MIWFNEDEINLGLKHLIDYDTFYGVYGEFNSAAKTIFTEKVIAARSPVVKSFFCV
jgi:hypothetical protein